MGRTAIASGEVVVDIWRPLGSPENKRLIGVARGQNVTICRQV
jgi:hypothetical protein